MTNRITRLRRAHRYAEAEELIKSELTGADVEIELGRIAFQRERFAVAAEHFERALSLDQGTEAAQAWQVAVLSRRRRYAEARAAADKCLAIRPDAHLVRIARARVADDETGDAQYLLDEVDIVLAADPDHLEALQWRISALGGLNRCGDARIAAQDAMRRHPDVPELSVMWSSVLAGTAHFTEAVAQCDAALLIQPDYVMAHYLRSIHLRDNKMYDEAIAYAEHAVGRCPEVSSLYLVWSMALRAIQDFGGTLEKAEKAVELDPYVGRNHEWRAFALRALGRLDESAEAIRAGREYIPDSVEIMAQQAWLFYEVDDMDAAVAASRELLEMAPLDPCAIDCGIRILRYASRFREAESVAKVGVETLRFDADIVSHLGWVYSDQDRDEEALEQFRRAADLDPHSVKLRAYVGRALRWLHRTDEAERYMVDVLAGNGDQVVLAEELALIYEKDGRHDEALRIYERINRKWPNYLGAWVGRARIMRYHQRFGEAEQAAEEAVRLNPFSQSLRIDLARGHRMRGDESAAVEVLRVACADLPHRRLLCRELATSLRLLGEFDQALETLARMPEAADVERDRIRVLRDAREHQTALEVAAAAAAKYPQDIRFPSVLGDIRADLDDYEAAITAYEAALEIDPGYRTALRGKATCLRKLRRFGEAERLLAAQVVRLPNYVSFRLDLAVTYARMERTDDVVAQYEHALRIDPRDAELLRYYGKALRRIGRWQDAERVLSGAVELLPNEAELAIELGILCDEQNRREEALRWFDRALALEPKSFWALQSKSATLRSLSRFDEAERLLKSALERKTVTANLVIEWGWVLRDRGQLTRAKQAFERALTLAVGKRSRADVLHCLGWVAFSANDFQQASKQFREALDEHPESRIAKIGLAWTLVREQQPNGEAEAERLCLEVLDDRPRTHLAHTCLGVLYAQQNNLPQAEYHLRRSIEIDPYGGSYVDLGALFVQMDRFAEAEVLLSKALERNWYDSQAHIELGGLYLQRDFDGGTDAGADARQAAQHFRQALVIDPRHGAAAIGLSLALIRSPGDLLAAERVLREALARTDCDQPRWQLLVALARLLIERGDATQRRDLHLEALSIAEQAIEHAADQADPHYVAGVAAYKAGDSGPEAQARPFYRRRALRHFRRCLSHDPAHTEARRVMTLAAQSLAIARTSLVGSVALMLVASGLLVAIWVGFFLTDKVTTVLIATLTPVLVGLVALGFVLPFLVRLRLPGGVEADLSASLNQVSSGPTGEVSIGPGRLVGRSPDGSAARSPLNAGPRGELPRLG